MDIANLLWFLVPNAVFTMSGNDYSDIIWTDERTQPTFEELEEVLPAYQENVKTTQQNRVNARQELIARLDLTEEEKALLR